MKLENEDQQQIDPLFYQQCPKAVLAGILVSFLTNLYDTEGKSVTQAIKYEWETLYTQDIIQQKPPKI